jgi:formyltetrahydrofolate-dependent phosphoribosylglycinamide formyltransferase
MRTAVLLSGSGRTLQNFIDLTRAGELPIEIALVISSRADVAGIDRARDAGLPVEVVPRKGASAEAFDRRITEAIDRARVELICLAGFLSKWTIPPRYAHRVMNIHPALLPKFGGKGYFGHHVHEAVLAAGETESGCTVHFADNEYDQGPIILQRKVPVLPNDTPDTLAARVFEQECIAYPEAIRLFAAGRLTFMPKKA